MTKSHERLCAYRNKRSSGNYYNYIEYYLVISAYNNLHNSIFIYCRLVQLVEKLLKLNRFLFLFKVYTDNIIVEPIDLKIDACVYLVML